MTAIVARIGGSLCAPAAASAPLRTNPAAVYLARLAVNSRETMGRCLRNLASLAGHTPESLPWSSLRYQDTQAIRTVVAERYGATAQRARRQDDCADERAADRGREAPLSTG